MKFDFWPERVPSRLLNCPEEVDKKMSPFHILTQGTGDKERDLGALPNGDQVVEVGRTRVPIYIDGQEITIYLRDITGDRRAVHLFGLNKRVGELDASIKKLTLEPEPGGVLFVADSADWKRLDAVEDQLSPGS